MIRWNNLSIRTKLAYIFGAGVLLLAFACYMLITLNAETVDHADSTLLRDEYALNLTLREIDHLRWTAIVGEYALQPNHGGNAELNVQADGTLCAFGKWYYGPDRQKLEALLPSTIPLLAQLEKPHLALHTSSTVIKKHILDKDEAAAAEVFIDTTQVNSATVLKTMARIREEVAKSADRERNEFHLMAQYSKNLTIAILFGAILSSLLVGVFFAQNISRPLIRIADTAREIAHGNLSLRLNMRRKDEAGQIARSLDSMVDSLNQKIEEADTQTVAAKKNSLRAENALSVAEEKELHINAILDTISVISTEALSIAQKLNEDADVLAVRTDQVKAGSFAQKEKLESASAAMTQMNLVVTEIAQRAENAANSAVETQNNAQSGSTEMTRSVDSIQSVNKVTDLLQTDIRELGVQAESISSVMSVIAEIADQTNLLALNAAIEAARAGDAGRGFAVVADEVRKLAEKTMHSTQEVGSKIKAIQKTIYSSTANMDNAAQAVESTTTLITCSGESLQKILALAEQNTDYVHGIATAAEEHAMGAAEISQQISAVAHIAEENAQGMSTTVQVVHELAQTAHALRTLIERLKASG